MPSRAHEFFRQIVEHGNPARFLEEMVHSKRPENEFLEFKGASKIQRKQVKEFWSQALSGFANTEGGVLIWGVRADRVQSPDDPSRRIDVAHDLDLVPNPTTFVQSLKDLLLEAVIEPLQGIDFADFNAQCGGEEGFVVCLIPEGDHKPYRGLLASPAQYYQRIGDNFVVIPHSLLRSLFYPRITPILSISIVAKSHADEHGASVTFEGEIGNAGKGTARDICVLVESPMKATMSPHGYQVKDLGSHSSDQGSSGSFRLKQYLHPGQSHGLFRCQWSGEATRDYGQGTGRVRAFSFAVSLTEAFFRMRIFSLDQEEQDVEATFDADELRMGTIKEARRRPAFGRTPEQG